MAVGLVGVGRMGRALATRLVETEELYLFDRDPLKLQSVSEALGLAICVDMESLADLGTVILAVPDREVISCIKVLNQLQRPLTVINVATNVSRHVLQQIAASHVRPINVKFVGHADEMLLGQCPVIIIDEQPAELVPLAQKMFQAVGQVIVGKADLVTSINTTAAEKVLVAAVCIEENLRLQNVTDHIIVKTAIRQVAVGILKAYADGDMGPFAREIVQAVRAKMKKT